MLAHTLLCFGRRWRIEHLSVISARLHGSFLFHACSKNGGWKWSVHAFSKNSMCEVNGVAVHRSMVRIASVKSKIVLYRARQLRKLCSEFTLVKNTW